MNPTQHPTDLAVARQMDAADPLRSFRSYFHIPKRKDGSPQIYLCGNSLGLQPKRTKEYIEQELTKWESLGIEGYFEGDRPWLKYHEVLSPLMAEVVGAKPHEVVVMNTLTVNLHLMLTSFYQPVSKRYKILIESDAFPSDIYAAESHIRLHGYDPKDALVRVTPRAGETCLRHEDILEKINACGDALALVLIGTTNYYTGQSFDLKGITAAAHGQGAMVGFDCAHGAGNLDLDLHNSGCDFAVWCNYKYINSGPGSPGSYFVHERHAKRKDLPRLSGWWGHNEETRFEMRGDFDPMYGAAGWQVSCPTILALAGVRASLDIFQQAGIKRIRSKSVQLSGYLALLIKSLNSDKIEIITPQDPDGRGAQLSLHIKQHGKEIFDHMTAHGIVGDWREPNVIRLSPAPLYNTYEEVHRCYEIIKSSPHLR